MTLHENKLSTITAAWLLPIVSTIVAAASGGIVADVLPNPQHALWTLTISYIFWGTGVPLAIFTLVLYFQRLTVHNLPPREAIVSVFLPLGPLGQGMYISETFFPPNDAMILTARLFLKANIPFNVSELSPCSNSSLQKDKYDSLNLL